jgi:hypothetical protein
MKNAGFEEFDWFSERVSIFINSLEAQTNSKRICVELLV